MSRTRRPATAAVALAAVLGVVALTTPVGATTALWRDEVRVDGVTVVVAPPPCEPGSVDGSVELPPSGSGEHERTFCYEVALDLDEHELPLILEMEHGWSALVTQGDTPDVKSTATRFWIVPEGGVPASFPFRTEMSSIPGSAQMGHNLYHEPKLQNQYDGTKVPADVTGIKVRIQVHAVNFYSPAPWRLEAGSGLASFYRPGDDQNPTGQPVFQTSYTLPALYWDGPPVPESDPESSTLDPGPTSTPDPLTGDVIIDDVAAPHDEDPEASP